MMLLSEFGRNRNTLTPLCNMKKNMYSRTLGGGGGIESTLKTIVQHEKNMYVKSLFYFTSGWWVGTGRRMSSTCS